jgi:hypothetical protein
MRPRLDSRNGTFTDAARRLKDVLPRRHVPSAGDAGPSEADLPISGIGGTAASFRSVPVSVSADPYSRPRRVAGIAQ